MIRSLLTTLLSPLLVVLDPARAQRRADARWNAAAPDRDHRIDGQARPAAVSDPDDIPLRDPPPSLRERVASAMVGAGVSVVRPKKGDVLVVRSDLPLEGLTSFVERMWRDHGVLMVILPTDCRVHAEPAAKPREDLGYRETKNTAVDAGVLAPTPRPSRFNRLHEQWTAAVGTPGYHKPWWGAAEAALLARGADYYNAPAAPGEDIAGVGSAPRLPLDHPDVGPGNDGETGKQVCGAEKASG